ncbi:MAG: EF-hand domain-containing protein, partial [Gemmataceae bacterium]|nr:EF-hand domain-containing protein [Gemmataceae bacterium]
MTTSAAGLLVLVWVAGAESSMPRSESHRGIEDSAPATQPVLLFPAGDAPARLRLEVTADGTPPDAAWAVFLDKLFLHFDRDGDGSLSAAEAGRVFPLPLPDGREAGPDFPRLDADKDGKGTRAEFRAFYRAAGFTPVVAAVRPGPAADLALGDALFRHLDRDGDGAVSAAELRQAPALVRRLDEDEDEVLTAAELLGPAPAAPAKVAGLKLAPADDRRSPDAALRLPLGKPASLVGLGGAFRLAPDGSGLPVPGGTCTITPDSADALAGFRAAKGGYLSQFRAAGDKPVGKKVFADDPAAQVLAGLFDAADRDGDGQLTRAGVEAFFDLVEQGVGCRVVVTATDRGRDLHDLFDANGDGRLDLGELTRAARAPPAELAGDNPLARDAVPASYRLTVGRGPVGEAFGPVPFGAAGRPKPPPGPPAARGPRWFRAMDRNGDGSVSPAEFVGPPGLFDKLDAAGDGRIGPEEAEKADAGG